VLIITNLTKDDIGRKVIYGRAELPKQEGTLSSWNETYIFVKFGEHANACDPGDVSFVFDHCTVDSIGIKISGADAPMVTEPFNKYLNTFAATKGKCPNCGTTLGGLLGSFAWGSINGEGYCTGDQGKCNWPCRAIHRPTFDDGKVIFEQALENVLPYHPDFVKPAQDKAIIEDSWLSLAKAIKLRPGTAQHHDMKAAFFGGALTVLGTMRKIGEIESDDVGVDILASMWDECIAFRDASKPKQQ
jgi:hypothetical protein